MICDFLYKMKNLNIVVFIFLGIEIENVLVNL